jgi:hypothetical protein
VKLTPIAQALVAVIKGIGLNEYLWEPKDLRPPAGSVSIPTLERTEPDGAESQLHADDWDLGFTVSLYFDLAHVAKAQQAMVDALEAFVDAIDADHSLDGTVFDCAVTDAVPFVERDRKRPLVGYEITVAVELLVSSP